VVIVCNATASPCIYSLSLHDALPIFSHWFNSAAFSCTLTGCPPPTELPAYGILGNSGTRAVAAPGHFDFNMALVRSFRLKESQRSEEHTSELQSRFDLVCRLLLEKKR